LPAYNKEDGTLNVIRKNPLTADISEADDWRDSLGTGLIYTVRGTTYHFAPARREAAKRVLVVVENYGNINRKSYDEQTAAINSMVKDLQTDYADDIAALGLEKWVTELAAANKAFEELMQKRYEAEAGKPQYTMKTAREEVDDAYRAITERIGALIIVNGEKPYAGFVNDLNERIERYNNAVSRRYGRNEKEDEQ
jgi:thiamine pyrophosphate-dependent acetolactate synthase large subunit-like protein